MSVVVELRNRSAEPRVKGVVLVFRHRSGKQS
jgi:hypothetical protein